MIYRVENKYCCSMPEMYRIQKMLSIVMTVDSNESNADGYSISSLYFDDLEDSCFKDTVDGNTLRNKYRIRIYNHSLNTIKLEIKEKRDSRIRKICKNITKDQMWKLIQGECIEDSASK